MGSCLNDILTNVRCTRRELYRGYVVDCIDAGFGYISFTNGVSLNIGETIGNYGDDLMKAQIRETIKEHLDKELAVKRQLRDRPLKVLSLFFIDRVANYASADGKLRQWFVEIYQEFSQLPRYQSKRWRVILNKNDYAVVEYALFL